MPPPIARRLLDASTSHRLRLRGGVAAGPVRQLAAARRDHARPVLQGAGDRRQRLRAAPGAEDRARSAPDLSPEAAPRALESAAGDRVGLREGGRAAAVREEQLDRGAVRAPFFRAVGTIDSAFESGRVLQAVAKRTDLSDETILESCARRRAISSDFESVAGAARRRRDHQRSRARRAMPTSTPPRSSATTNRAGCSRRW